MRAAVLIRDDVRLDSACPVGCGGVGLNVIQGAAACGAEKIIAVDYVARRLGCWLLGWWTSINLTSYDPNSQHPDS